MSTTQTKEMDLTVVKEILNQLNQSRIHGFPFFAYTGMKPLGVISDTEISMKAKRNPSGFSKVGVKYNYDSDTYTVKFIKNSGIVESVDDVYFNEMAQLIVDKLGIN